MKSIGKYQVVEDLGASPTSKTYRARDSFRHSDVAVKILESVPGLSAEAKEQFCTYLASCAELTHRHIAKVQDLGELDEGIFIASEWRSGMDLKRFREANRDLPLDQKLGIIAQVAEGLAFAHSREIAHGDLKPSNILVDASRDASILDFGVARWLAGLLEAGGRPQGLIANYLAPEQVLGQPFDARSDIFALAVMLYEFIADRYPFSADAGLIPREIVHAEPQPLRQLNAQAPEDLEQLIARALAKNPEQRLQTAEEFASGLYLAAQNFRRATAPEPVPSSPPSTENIFAQIPPALTSQAFIPEPSPAPAPASPKLQDAASQDTPRVRERPQDADSNKPRPWTARSYAAARETPRDTAVRPSARAASDQKLPVPMAPPEPVFVPPQSFLQSSPSTPEAAPAPSGKTSGKWLKGLLAGVAGLILAAVVAVSFLARQPLRGSPDRSHAASEPSQTAPAVVKPVAPPRPEPPAAESHAAKAEQPPADNPTNPEVSVKQILNGPVRTLWESGRYGQAMAYVNQVLAVDPMNEEARAWKKKIREAQAAEAALK